MRGLLMMAQSSLTENLCGQCRICMDIKLNQISVFKNDLSLKIEQIADVEVAPDDGLPTSICLDCEVLLNKCYELRERVIFADNTFREGISFSKVVIEEYIVKEETSASCANDEAMEDGIYDSSFDHENDNHVEVMDVIERTDRTAMLNDPLSLEEPLIEARGGSNSAIDPLACMKVEPVGMDCDSGAGPSTSTAVGKTGLLNQFALSSDKQKNSGENLGLESIMLDDRVDILLESNSGPHLIISLDAEQNADSNITTLVNNRIDLQIITGNSEITGNMNDSIKTKPRLKRKNIIDRNKSLKCASSSKKAKLSTPFISNKIISDSFCETCNVNCGSVDLFKDHKEGTGFICRVCVGNFETHAQLETHFVSHPALVCPICGDLYFSRKDLWNHRKSSTTCGYPMIECAICHKSLLKTSLRSHMVNFHSEDSGKHRCIVCGKSYKRAYLLKNHLTSVHIVYEKSKCKFCDRYLMGPDRMKDHVVAKHVEPNEDCEILSCSECGEKFRNKLKFKYHSDKHDKTISLCEICGISIEGKLALKSHMEKLHPKVGVFTCHICNDVFDVELELKRHKKRHVKRSDPVPSFCEICGKIFTSKANLKNHIRIHFNEKPFKCDICGYEFRQKVTLNTHMRVHSSEGKFSCNFCGKTFKWKQTFERHVSKCDGFDHSQSFHQIH